MNNKGESMNNKWTKYHETRRSLIESIKSHLNSVEDVNVYNSVSNTSGDYHLTNQSMGYDLMLELISKLKIN
jgi:hypothetical protein